MKYLLSGVLGFFICFGILVGFRVYNGEPKLIIQTNDIVQYKVQKKYIRIPYTVTKTNIYTNYIFVLDELNQFKTNNGYISLSNSRIYAGLYTRYWSVPYKILQPSYNHSIGVLIGDGLLIDYGYQILERIKLRGGIYSQDKNTSLLIGSEFKF